MQDKNLFEKLQSARAEAEREGSEDSKIYTTLINRISEHLEKDVYYQFKALATFKYNNEKLLQHLPKESTLIPKILKENEIVSKWLPSEASEEEVVKSILELLNKNIEITKIIPSLKPIYGGRFSRLRATKILVDILNKPR